MSRKFGPKTSKMANEEEEQEEVLDLSIKKQKTDIEEEKNIRLRVETMPKNIDYLLPWGCLQFYDSGKPVFSQILRGNEPIEINTDILLSATPAQPQEPPEKNNPNPNMNYTDWLHVIGKGFTLRRKDVGEKFSSVEMRCLDEPIQIPNKYKILVDDKQIAMTGRYDIYEIYDGNHIFQNRLSEMKDLNDAYALAHSCHLIIAVYGEFITSAGLLPLTYEAIRREMIPNYPYWFYLKLFPEFDMVDRAARKLLSTKH